MHSDVTVYPDNTYFLMNNNTLHAHVAGSCLASVYRVLCTFDKMYKIFVIISNKTQQQSVPFC